MPGAADFVRGTLAYLFNCVVAVLTLVGTAIRFRPIKGALRCKAKQERAGSDAPDGRLMLFLGCCLFGTVCTYAAHGLLATATIIAQSLVASSVLPKSALVTATFFYFTCELAIHRSNPRRLVPGRKGRRNREILRFLLASLLIQLTIYEPIALYLLSRVSKISWSELTGRPDSDLGEVVDMVFFIARLSVVLLPFFYLNSVLSRFKLDRQDRDPLALGGLPINLVAAALVASFVSPAFWPPAQPMIVTLRCRLDDEGNIAVDALFRNDGDQYWTPAKALELAIVGPAGSDPQLSNIWKPAANGEGPVPMIIPPHGETHFRRRAFFGPDLDTSHALGCSLTDNQPWPGPSFLFTEELPPRDLVWTEIAPSNTKVGPISEPERSPEPDENQQNQQNQQR